MPDDETSPPDESGRRAANRAELLDKAIQRMEEKLGSTDVKATFSDFIKLLQLQKEMQVDQPREIKGYMDRTQRDGVCFRGIKYSPLPSQNGSIVLRRDSKDFRAYRLRKSQALCHEAIKLSYLNRAGLTHRSPYYPMLRDATLATLFDILNTNLIPYEYTKSDNVLTMVDTQSRVLCRSTNEFERLRGTNLAWFALDELTYSPEAAWLRAGRPLADPKASRLCGFRRLDTKGLRLGLSQVHFGSPPRLPNNSCPSFRKSSPARADSRLLRTLEEQLR